MGAHEEWAVRRHWPGQASTGATVGVSGGSGIGGGGRARDAEQPGQPSSTAIRTAPRRLGWAGVGFRLVQ